MFLFIHNARESCISQLGEDEGGGVWVVVSRLEEVEEGGGKVGYLQCNCNAISGISARMLCLNDSNRLRFTLTLVRPKLDFQQ